MSVAGRLVRQLSDVPAAIRNANPPNTALTGSGTVWKLELSEDEA